MIAQHVMPLRPEAIEDRNHHLITAEIPIDQVAQVDDKRQRQLVEYIDAVGQLGG